MAIRGVIFDCFGVLCHGSLDYLRSITPPARLAELNDLNRASDYGYVTQDEYARQVSEIVGRPADEIAALTRAQCVRSDLMTELIRSLKPTYKIAMLSNIGSGFMDELFSQEERAELFDVVVLSSEVGVTKPSRAAFELTAQRLGLLPQECVMIDDLPRNTDGAERAGMRGLLCESPEQCATDLRALLEESDA